VSKTKYQKSAKVCLWQKSYGYVKNNNFWQKCEKIKAFEKTSYNKLTLLKYDHLNDEMTII